MKVPFRPQFIVLVVALAINRAHADKTLEVKVKIPSDNINSTKDSGSGVGNIFGPDAVVEYLVDQQVIPDFPAALERIRDAIDRSDKHDDVGQKLSELEEQIKGQLLQAGHGQNPFFLLGNINLSNNVLQRISSVVELVNARIQPGESFSRGGQLASIVRRASTAILADPDPYIALRGSITNALSDENLDIFVNFEEALFDALPRDTPLSSQMFLAVDVEDTNGDGLASARSASLSFSAFGTNNLDSPTVRGIRPLGLVANAFGTIRDTDSDGLEEPLVLLTDPQPVDLTNPSNVPDEIPITHLVGGLNVEDLSPSDTVNYTAVLSVGIDGNDAVPLISADALGSFLTGFDLLVESTNVVECNPNTQGDIDGNGLVNFGDFLILAEHFGQPATDHTTGDLDCSGLIVFPDFLIFAQNFGSEVAAKPVTVPEPQSAQNLLFCMLAAVFARSGVCGNKRCYC